MLYSTLAWGLVLIFLGSAFGQFAENPQKPIPLDPEYRKLDVLVSFIRNRNADKFAITSPKGIDEASYVPIGGIEQWVKIRGQDGANPVLLFVHGGPGDVTSCWSFFEGADAFLAGTLGLALVAPGCSVEDINNSSAGQSFSAEQLVGQTKPLGPKDLGLKFSIPIFFFQGDEDFTTPTVLARNYLQQLQAPRKEFVAIQGAGHFAMFMHPDKFLAELVSRVRPLAVGP